jgi:hypothetical protein
MPVDGDSGLRDLCCSDGTSSCAGVAPVLRKSVDLFQSAGWMLVWGKIKRIPGLYAAEELARGQPPPACMCLRQAHRLPCSRFSSVTEGPSVVSGRSLSGR